MMPAFNDGSDPGNSSAGVRKPEQATGEQDVVANVFAGGGELGGLMRAKDWSLTPLGPPDQWPQSLKTCVRIMLTSRQPMFVWWGEELINLYNDAYKSIVGGKHPEALGQPASVVWREIWDRSGRARETAMRRNEGTYDEALLLIMERNGYPGGDLLHLLLQPRAERRGRYGRHHLRQHRRHPAHHRRAAAGAAARAGGPAPATRAHSPRHAGVAARGLATDPRDLPFALIYLVEPDQRQRIARRRGGHRPGSSRRGRRPCLLDEPVSLAAAAVHAGQAAWSSS